MTRGASSSERSSRGGRQDACAWPIAFDGRGVDRLVIVLGDQLDANAEPLKTIDADRDAVLIMEVRAESLDVPSHVQRTVMFLSAMRHFALQLAEAGVRVRYIALTDAGNTGAFSSEIQRAIDDLRPRGLRCTRPGDWRVQSIVEEAARRNALPLTIDEDPHFTCSPAEFAAWAKGRTSLTMEFFYREQRRRTGYLMENGRPVGGEWNFDKLNRLPFGAEGPRPPPPRPPVFTVDAVTRDVIRDVRTALPGLYGRLDDETTFRWPVTRSEAVQALEHFIQRRLASFGPYEDAMWSTEPFVYHSLLSPALNLKLLSPRECCDAAIRAYSAGRAPLQSVEAFIRQIIGWREFIRGVYILEGATYAQRNGLEEHGRLPEFYWTGETDMACMRRCITQVVDTGYAHHIQRLMVMGNFALISGVHPKLISDWYLGMFVDGVDWVTLPNTLGMVMHADRRADASASETGLVGTKPYAATANYIGRMSDYCRGCRYDPKARSGDRACPFNVLYWDFLSRHRDRLGRNQRMAMALRNVDRLTTDERVRITVSARTLRERFGIAAADGSEIASTVGPPGRRDASHRTEAPQSLFDHTPATPKPRRKRTSS